MPPHATYSDVGHNLDLLALNVMDQSGTDGGLSLQGPHLGVQTPPVAHITHTDTSQTLDCLGAQTPPAAHITNIRRLSWGL